MRDLPDEMAARLESGAATLCHAWTLTRRDGFTLGFTDHDRDLEVAGVVCRAESGWTLGAGAGAAGLSASDLTVSGVLEAEGLTEAALSGGLWDGAVVELWRVDWARPDLRVRLWRGEVARVTRDRDRFTAELQGPLAKLERVIGRTYGRGCEAALGDARCGVDLATFPGATCDKRWETCVEEFGNGLNFRGFPDVPGEDFLGVYPQEGAVHDGGSRR